jgi:hypothetical protein
MSSALNKPKYKMIIDTIIKANKEESLTHWIRLATEGALHQYSKSRWQTYWNHVFLNRMSLLMVQPRNLVIVENHMFKLLNVTKLMKISIDQFSYEILLKTCHSDS